MASSYKEFTTQELEKAAARVLSQTKRYTYSSNKLQPSDRMQGKKVGGSRRKSNRPSTPSINMSMKTSKQIYNNRQPGQRQTRSSSNSHRRYGRYNSDSQVNSKLKLRHDLPTRRRRAKYGGDDENYGFKHSRKSKRSQSDGKRTALSSNKKLQGLHNYPRKKKKKVGKRYLGTTSSGVVHDVQQSPARNTRGSSESDASTIAGFIKRFRDDEPSSPEARSKQMRKNKNSFWWKSGENVTEDGVSPSPARGSGKEAVARLREKSQQQESGEVQMRKTKDANATNEKGDLSDDAIKDSTKSPFYGGESKDVPCDKSNEKPADLETRTKSILDHCDAVLTAHDPVNITHKHFVETKSQGNTDTKMSKSINSLDVRTKKVLEDCDEILSMNRIETKCITVEEGLDEKLTVDISPHQTKYDAREQVAMDANDVLKRAQDALNRATQDILDDTVDPESEHASGTLVPSIKAMYNNDCPSRTSPFVPPQVHRHVCVDVIYGNSESNCESLESALLEAVRRGLF